MRVTLHATKHPFSGASATEVVEAMRIHAGRTDTPTVKAYVAWSLGQVWMIFTTPPTLDMDGDTETVAREYLRALLDLGLIEMEA